MHRTTSKRAVLDVRVLGKAGSRRMNRLAASESKRITYNGEESGGGGGEETKSEAVNGRMDGRMDGWKRTVFPKANNYFFSQVSPRTSFGSPGMLLSQW